MSFVPNAAQDIRYAFRTLRREPIFAAGVIMTLALAIGMNAAMFGLVERLMLAPPPGVRDAPSVVRVGVNIDTPDGDLYTITTFSYPAFRALEGAANAFSAVAAVSPTSMTVGSGVDRTEVGVIAASGEYFRLVGVSPARGRTFGPGDDELPLGNPVAVLGDAYWRRQYGGDASVVGTQIIIDDQPYTIIGITPAGFNGTDVSAVDVYVPLSAAFRNRGPDWVSNPGMHIVSVIARVKADVTPALAATMAGTTLRADPAAPAGDQFGGVNLESVMPGRSARNSAQSRIALWLSGVSVVVLLIATANVSTLLLLRAARRRRDNAMRVALGAGRARLVQLSLAESLLLSLAGAGMGLVVARWFTGAVRVLLMPALPAGSGTLDATVLLTSVIAAIVAGAVAGLVPLLYVRKHNLSAELRTGGGHGSSGRFVFHHALVAVQVALCTVALVGAGLFVRSLSRVESQDLGFSTAHLLYASIDFRVQTPGQERDRVYEEAVRRVTPLPGVTAATLVQGMPFSSFHIPPMSVPGVEKPLMSFGQIPIMYGATPQYLDMMGVTLREGRMITAADGRGAPLVILVNESMARNLWPGQRALGKCVRAGMSPHEFDEDPMAAAATLPCREVVGVVRDSRARSLRTEGNETKLMQYYVPFEQLPLEPGTNYAGVHGILIRTAGDPKRMASQVQRAIQGATPIPVYANVHPYQEHIDPQLRSWRLGATLFSAFGLLALGIAAVGLSAVISYLVSQRTQEIGVRLALGGTRGRVAQLVVRDAVRMAGIGVVAGVVIALAGAPAVRSMLFQTEPREPVSLIIASAVMLFVAVGAATVPALRASRVNPMLALRADV